MQADTVTIEDLQAHVWRRLGIRKFAAGRHRVDRLTRLAVQHWQGDAYAAAGSDADRDAALKATAEAVKQSYREAGDAGEEYGFVLWIWLLSTVLSAVVQIIVKWWLERRRNQTLMLVWQQEMMG